MRKRGWLLVISLTVMMGVFLWVFAAVCLPKDTTSENFWGLLLMLELGVFVIFGESLLVVYSINDSGRPLTNLQALPQKTLMYIISSTRLEDEKRFPGLLRPHFHVLALTVDGLVGLVYNSDLKPGWHHLSDYEDAGLHLAYPRPRFLSRKYLAQREKIRKEFGQFLPLAELTEQTSCLNCPDIS